MITIYIDTESSDEPIVLTVDEARKLYTQLQELFAHNAIISYPES